MRLRTQCLLLCATNAAALQLQPAPQLAKRPHQQPRVILTTEQVEKLERSVAAALPAVGQWAAFGGVVSAFSGFLWGYAGLPAAALYASSVASGTAWALAWDHVMPGGGRRVAEMMGGTTVGVPCSVRDAVVPTRAEINCDGFAFLAPRGCIVILPASRRRRAGRWFRFGGVGRHTYAIDAIATMACISTPST